MRPCSLRGSRRSPDSSSSAPRRTSPTSCTRSTRASAMRAPAASVKATRQIPIRRQEHHADRLRHGQGSRRAAARRHPRRHRIPEGNRRDDPPAPLHDQGRHGRGVWRDRSQSIRRATGCRGDRQDGRRHHDRDDVVHDQPAPGRTLGRVQVVGQRHDRLSRADRPRRIARARYGSADRCRTSRSPGPGRSPTARSSRRAGYTSALGKALHDDADHGRRRRGAWSRSWRASSRAASTAPRARASADSWSRGCRFRGTCNPGLRALFAIAAVASGPLR